MTTQYPKNFGAMLNAFFSGWKPNEECLDYQHLGRKIDQETGKEVTVPGRWTPCRSITELIGISEAWPIYDSYTTAQRFTKWEVKAAKDGNTIPVESNHDTYRLDRVYSDSDPEEGRQDCLDDLPKYKRMQDALEVNGKTPVWVICSGRGYHTYTYLERFISAREGQQLQDILGYVFDLQFDIWTRIVRAHMMRLPYSKNSRTNTWVLSVSRNMTLGGLRNAMKSELLDGCHWENPIRVPPEHILKLHPGTKVLEEFREKKREKARAKIRRGMEKKAREAKKLLDEGKSWPEIAKLMGYQNERHLRYWTERFGSL